MLLLNKPTNQPTNFEDISFWMNKYYSQVTCPKSRTHAREEFSGSIHLPQARNSHGGKGYGEVSAPSPCSEQGQF